MIYKPYTNRYFTESHGNCRHCGKGYNQVSTRVVGDGIDGCKRCVKLCDNCDRLFYVEDMSPKHDNICVHCADYIKDEE